MVCVLRQCRRTGATRQPRRPNQPFPAVFEYLTPLPREQRRPVHDDLDRGSRLIRLDRIHRELS